MSGLLSMLSSLSGGGGSGMLGALGELSQYSSLLGGGGSGAANSPISTVLSMLQSGPNSSHASELPGQSSQGVFSQLLDLKQSLTGQVQNQAQGSQADPSVINQIQSQLNNLTSNDLPNAVQQDNIQNTPHEHALNGLVAQIQAGLTHLQANSQGGAGGLASDIAQY